MHRLLALLPAAACLVSLAGCQSRGAGTGDGASPTPSGTAPAASSPAPDLREARLWLSFEDRTVAADGTTVFSDANGSGLQGLVVSASGGRVELSPGPDGAGAAIAFPSACAAASGCPRAMVEVGPDASLDPGTEEFTFGAAVWLAPDQTTSGSNIVQQGRFDTEGGQWKLQVDDLAGHPSCVVRSGDEPLLVRSRVSVADAAWHRIVCRRDDEGVTITVDGVEDRTPGVTGEVSSPWPVRVGSPGVDDDDDQFHGRVDDVFVSIGD